MRGRRWVAARGGRGVGAEVDRAPIRRGGAPRCGWARVGRAAEGAICHSRGVRSVVVWPAGPAHCTRREVDRELALREPSTGRDGREELAHWSVACSNEPRAESTAASVLTPCEARSAGRFNSPSATNRFELSPGVRSDPCERFSRPRSWTGREPIAREATRAYAGADHPQVAGG